ncbi:flavin-containing monooxygenase [Mycolicibacterium lutetiense]|uniref:Cyclohexanone monooxygenase n=1 Tax=Mycolicibacterium lutetiense TaxID=1641992 RepID=A0ABS5A042_9MYCO|nr:NAD(P)/FAD-dependent oxidoreductase [Mycolicibacterium lutetiense]MBP2454778.1 cyclohexanone monooxygenase [Mycolicibacterium lutetiense]
MASSQIDTDALRQKYAQERDKRLRSDGTGQYVRLADLPGQSEDPFLPVEAREPKTDHVTVAVIGGGFSGLLTGARLKEAGIDSVRILDKAGDFGGVWYWNRYPGAQCDTASMVYMPLLEETGHVPTEKYAHGPEIYAQAQRIGKLYGLYSDVLFHTEITDLEWQEAQSRWLVSTNRGDSFTAQFIAMGTGPLSVAQLPGIPGIETFQGHSFHTSRWDYSYSGGDASGAPLEKLADKRVAVIGTGATAVQCVPQLAKDCKELFVFQRTPSAVAERKNHPIDPQWFEQMVEETGPGWQQRWMENFTTIWDGVLSEPDEMDADSDPVDLVQDGWTELAQEMKAAIHAVPMQERTLENIMLALEGTDNATMERIRARVDDVVSDPETAEKLKAWYRRMCKRPCFHDEYLQAFNRPNVHLIDTEGKGVERITESGVVVNGKQYDVDVIVYATGFEFLGGKHIDRLGYDPVGRDGRLLSDHWADGMRTLHGMHVHGFPNMFLLQMFQGAFMGANVPHNYVEQAKTIARLVKHATENGNAEVEVTASGEDQWVEMLLANGRPVGTQDCTPGYYNNEGREPTRKDRLDVGYPAGSMAFFKLEKQWRSAGTFEGLTLR